jgi:hypothetical protein
MRPVAANKLSHTVNYEFCSLLLQIILPAGFGITAREWTSERLDARMYPLVTL